MTDLIVFSLKTDPAPGGAETRNSPLRQVAIDARKVLVVRTTAHGSTVIVYPGGQTFEVDGTFSQVLETVNRGRGQ